MIRYSRNLKQLADMQLPVKLSNVKKLCPTVNFSRRFTDNTRTQAWEDKMKVWLRKYEDIFGITKLTEVHSKVTEVQHQMEDVQEKRRKVQQDILTVQMKLQEVQAKLEKTSRGDDIFLSIVTQEHELLKEQKRLSALIEVYDRTEREKQTALAVAINNSQDHERTYREKTKYLSLITGVVGGFIGVLGSSINNWRHRKDIKLFAGEIHDLIQSQNDIIAQQSFRQDNTHQSSDKEDTQQSFRQDNTHQSSDKEDTQQRYDQQNIQQEYLTALVSKDDLENLSSEMSELIRNMSEQFEDTVDDRIKSHMQTMAYLYGGLAVVSMVFYALFNNRL